MVKMDSCRTEDRQVARPLLHLLFAEAAAAPGASAGGMGAEGVTGRPFPSLDVSSLPNSPGFPDSAQ